jgi:glycosyltransferase involved in cell wall biosynthesis
MTKPKVTIGMCAKDAEKTIRLAMDSVVAQNFNHELMEIVFVDDGSNDNTLQIMQDLASKIDVKVRIFSGRWKGIAAARNTVVENADGDYIVWLDSDESIEQNFVRKQVFLMDTNPKAGIIAAIPTIESGENLVLTLDILPYVAEYHFRNYNNPLKVPGTGCSTYRLAAVKEVGGFNEKLSGACEDIEVANRIRQAGWLIVRSHSKCRETHGELSSWTALWKKNFNRGIHCRQFQNETNTFFSLYRMNPLASLVAGFRRAFLGYIATKKKIAFLLPLHFTFKMTAWFYGFTKSR